MSVENQQIGPYLIQRLLGFGSLGEVYLVEDPRYNQAKVLKLLRGSILLSPQEALLILGGIGFFLLQQSHPSSTTAAAATSTALANAARATSSGNYHPGYHQLRPDDLGACLRQLHHIAHG